MYSLGQALCELFPHSEASEHEDELCAHKQVIGSNFAKLFLPVRVARANFFSEGAPALAVLVKQHVTAHSCVRAYMLLTLLHRQISSQIILYVLCSGCTHAVIANNRKLLASLVARTCDHPIYRTCWLALIAISGCCFSKKISNLSSVIRSLVSKIWHGKSAHVQYFCANSEASVSTNKQGRSCCVNALAFSTRNHLGTATFART